MINKLCELWASVVNLKPQRHGEHEEIKTDLKNLITILMLFTAAMLYPQQAVIPAGGDASGAGGSLSFSLGQVFNLSTEAVNFVEWQGVQQSYINMWEGYTDTNWGSTSNWLLGSVPMSGDDILFDLTPFNHCVMDQNRTIGSLTNAQSTYRMVTNGYNLTINGSFNQSNGAQVDASAAGSIVTFAGSSAQTIPAGTFYNNQVVNVAINNANNVTLNGNLSMSGSLTAASGALDAATQSPSVTLNGSSAQTLENSTWLNDRIYNLTVANAAGVTDNATFTVTNNFTINAGSVFTVAPAKTLNVNGTLTNSAGTTGLVIASTAAGTGSVVHSTNNVPATVNRYVDGTASAWHFLSSPVSGQAIHGSGWTPSGTYGDGTGYDLYVWDEPASCWIYNLNTTVVPTWTTTHPSANFVGGRGYLYAVQATTPTKQFVGNLNNGTVNYSLNSSATGSYKGFNLIGNPYPSSIDWKKDGGYSRSNLELTGGGYNVWIWSATAGNYGVYNSAFAGDAGTNNVTRYIPPMEGFFVQAASAGTFSFYNSCRVHNEASNWLKVKPAETNNNLMKITVNSASVNGQDEVMLYFGCPDNVKGAMKIFNTSHESDINKPKAPGLFLPLGKENYSVRYFADAKASTIIPLNIKVSKNADYTLHFCIPDTLQNALLEDKLTGKISPVNNGGSYTFKAGTVDPVSRFNIMFGSVEEFEKLPVLVYRTGNDLIIDAMAMRGDYQIKLVDLTGRNYFTKYENGGTRIIVPVQIRQLYIVTITTDNQQSVHKIVF